MAKVLIINLKKYGDLFQSAHLVNSLKANSPSSEIHLLCYEECLSAAKIIRGINKVHTINRKKIVSFFKNPIYSDGLAFNEMEKELSLLKNATFDQVINYSNDLVTTYVTSFLDEGSDKWAGIKFSSAQTIRYSNQFSLVLNDILTTTPFTPFSFNDVYHHILGIALGTASSEGTIKSNKGHDQTALNNLNRLRTMKNKDQSSVSIIGIQICSSSESKDIPKNAIIEAIKLINESDNMVPILLTAPTESERKRANQINEFFENKLVSVESDFIALPSVLKNIDVLLTPDTSIKHLADLLRVPVVEVSLGEAPFLKQGSVNTRSIIISESAHKRLSTSDKDINPEISGSFLVETLKATLGIIDLDQISVDKNYCLYKPTPISDGVFTTAILGDFSPQFEAKRLLSRAVIQKTFLGTIDQSIFELLYSTISKSDISDLINKEKANLSILTKELLSTLRGLIQTQENKSKAPLFIESLERLLSKSFDNNLSSLPALTFRAKIESLSSSNLEDNFKEVEGLLYSLKDNVQHALFTLQRAEEFGYSVKKARVQQTSYTGPEL